MFKQALLHYAFAGASVIALFAFLLVFVGTLIWVYRKGSVEIYKHISDLPLDKSQEEGLIHE